MKLNDTGTALELIGDRGVAPGILERIRQISDTSGNPATFATMKSGADAVGRKHIATMRACTPRSRP